jgi:hypothetical protein
VEADQCIASRTCQRTGTSINPPERYTLASVKVYKSQEKDPERIKKIEKSEKEEIALLFVDLCGLQPVYEQRMLIVATCLV